MKRGRVSTENRSFDACYPCFSALMGGEWRFNVLVGRHPCDYEADELFLNTLSCDGLGRSYIQGGASLEGDLDRLFWVFEAACRVIRRDVEVHGAGKEKLNARGEIYGFGGSDDPAELQDEMSADLADASQAFETALKERPLPAAPPLRFGFRRAFPCVAAWLEDEGRSGEFRYIKIRPAIVAAAAVAAEADEGETEEEETEEEGEQKANEEIGEEADAGAAAAAAATAAAEDEDEGSDENKGEVAAAPIVLSPTAAALPRATLELPSPTTAAAAAAAEERIPPRPVRIAAFTAERCIFVKEMAPPSAAAGADEAGGRESREAFPLALGLHDAFSALEDYLEGLPPPPGGLSPRQAAEGGGRRLPESSSAPLG